jgi:hypothetical protein
MEFLQPYDTYMKYVRDILWDCQVIEAGLRRYITYSYKYIQKTMKNKISFRFNDKDICNDSFGVLVYKFEKFTDNSVLVSKLRKIIKYRNKCAHQAFALTARQLGDSDFLNRELEKYREIKSISGECCELIRTEYKKLEKVLHEAEKLSFDIENKIRTDMTV